ncbi:Peptidase C48, SUMO/Sentrin/Ubl1 [Corchorus capsularis]|uniref:Peptidase C48, SUMO/Sentrin/Ubl1 n=1 Tax=Corchorus capsularis TaxID=210143 RepID=A0A1R3I6H0_COCAP|nr:Peptidase C48, SUMO/Sentrin/Ubl1 [Corchorus capsularis]
MDAEGQNKKRKLKLDWNQLLSKKPGDDEPLPPLVVITTEPQQPGRQSDAMGGGDYQDREHLVGMTDRELDENIRRQRQTFENVASRLPDKGEKIRCKIERLEEEKERRKLSGRKMDANGFEKAPCSSSLTIVDCRIINGFAKETSVMNPCGGRKNIYNGEISQRERHRVRKSRRINSQHNRKPSFSDQKDRTASVHSLYDKDDNLQSIAKINASQVPPSNGSRQRKDRTVILVDEEEPQLVNTTELEVKLPNCEKNAKIYYPSRDDPESVEICFGDIDSLAPEGFLRSPIMNFYIRYLQQQASPTNLSDYHFFNTYFYPKLKEAVKHKVPQQPNEYDCGVFVLYFMERFIEEAPERLKSNDLAMFGKKWFKPQEASRLRVKIRNLLIEQFQSASEGVNGGSEPSSPSSSS